MPVSRDGHQYDRILFKPRDDCSSGGCHADLFLPDDASKPAPIAITYHGGAFTICDSQHIFTGHVGYLLERGFAVVSLEYRLAPHVRFAEQREDMLDGYRWVLNSLPDLYPGRLDSSRFFVFGGSAGGSATLFVAIDALKAGLPSARALYSVYPMVDLDKKEGGYPHTPYEVALNTLSATQRAKVDELLKEPVSTGYDIGVEDRTIPSGRRIWVELVTRQSALNGYMTGEHLPPFSSTHCITKLVGPGLPPTVLVLAEADQILDPSQTRELYERLLESGVEAKLIVAKGMPHGALERPRSTWPEGADWWDEVAVPALEWAMARCD